MDNKLVTVQQELYVEHRIRTYPFWHCVSKLTISDVNNPIVKRILEIHDKIFKH